MNNMKCIIKRSIVIISAFVLRKPTLKTLCLHILKYYPTLLYRLNELIKVRTLSSDYSVLPSKVDELTPWGKEIYTELCLLEKEKGKH